MQTFLKGYISNYEEEIATRFIRQYIAGDN